MDGMGWDGWISPGGPRYRAPYGANKCIIKPHSTLFVKHFIKPILNVLEWPQDAMR